MAISDFRCKIEKAKRPAEMAQTLGFLSHKCNRQIGEGARNSQNRIPEGRPHADRGATPRSAALARLRNSPALAKGRRLRVRRISVRPAFTPAPAKAHERWTGGTREFMLWATRHLWFQFSKDFYRM